MIAGKIFREITGVEVSELNTTSEVWAAVSAARPVNECCGSKEYAADVVTNRGSVFKFQSYDSDIDMLIDSL